MSQELHENIAAIAVNFASEQKAYATVIDYELTSGWIGLMREVVEWAKAFTAVEVAPATFDWYLAIDDFVEHIGGIIVETDDLPIDSKVKELAVTAIKKYTYV